MFPLPALVTPEPRPAERSVARRPGIVFTILMLFHTPTSCMSRNRRGRERAFAMRHPLPLDRLSNSPEMVYFAAESC
jgi:hypothetical protein